MLFEETFGPEHRPIVEFAVDNVQTLKQRKAKLQGLQQKLHEDPRDMQQTGESNGPNAHPNKKKTGKRKFKGDNESVNDSVPKKENEMGNSSANEGQMSSKRKKINSLAKGKKGKKFSATEVSGGPKVDSKVNPDSQKHARMPIVDTKSKPSETNVQPKKRKLGDIPGAEKGELNLKKRRRANKKEAPLGKDIVDKLDMLIEQYKSKYSQQSSKQTDGEKQGSRQLRKWFQT